MKEMEFNLLEEPWVRVLLEDYTVREVSLKDALLNAEQYIDLAGEVPTQDIAVLRLLLAILHTVFSRVDANGNDAPLETTDDALDRWEELWTFQSFPKSPILDYLEKWRERFWLFHPRRPFWQVPEANIGTEYSAAKLNGEILESGNKYRIFASYSGDKKKELSYAQAARWLLYLNGFDDASSKPKREKKTAKNLDEKQEKESTKSEKSVGVGWLGKIGLIWVQGENLFQTLMLNLCLLRDGEALWERETPCWELEEARNKERTEIVQPDNAAALLTLQSRRLLLHREAGCVTGYTLLGGDFFERENAFCEQMTVWRSVQAKKDAPLVFLPRRHDPSKQFWREFPTIFLDNPGMRQPGVVRWIVRLQRERILARENIVRFRIAAIEYGDKDFFVTDTFGDSLAFHLLLLDELSARWRAAVAEEVGRCEQLAAQLGYLAQKLALAAGGEKKAAPEDVKQRFYFQIDQLFRDWLESIEPSWKGEEEINCIRQWQEKAQQVARTLGIQLVLEAGTVAFAGRGLSEKIGKGQSGKEIKQYYSAPKAFNDFLWKIKRIYQDPQ